jgi:hypothetical protein
LRLGGSPFKRSRLPLASIDRIVSARLGTARVRGNAQPAVFNRQIAMYLAKHVGGWSTTRIGKFYNGRHHTTVLWALKRLERLRATDPRIEGLLSALIEEVRSRPATHERDHRVRVRGVTEHQLVPSGLDDQALDALADRIAERLQARGVHWEPPRRLADPGGSLHPADDASDRPQCYPQKRERDKCIMVTRVTT